MIPPDKSTVIERTTFHIEYCRYILDTVNLNNGYATEFILYKVNTFDEQDNPLTVEKLVTGSIKWDGCSHLNFGDSDGYLHLCGFRDWRSFTVVLEQVYKHISKTIEHFDKDYEEWKD